MATLMGLPKTAPVWLTVSALVIWLLCFSIPGEVGLSAWWVDAFKSCGTAILSGAVASGIVKSVQFAGVFKEELRTVLSERAMSWSDWEKMTIDQLRACCREGAAGALEAVSFYLGLNNDGVRHAYYSHCSFHFELRWLDEPAGVYEIEEVFNNDVRSNIGKEEVLLKYRWQGGPGETLSISELMVGAVDKRSAVKPQPGLVTYDLQLSGAESYSLVRKSKRSGVLGGPEPYVRCAFERIAHKVTVNIKAQSATIAAKVVPMGLHTDFSPNATATYYRHDGPFLPRHGFMLMVHRV